MFTLSRTTVLAVIVISHLSFEVTPGSPAHIHSHHLNKEREEDGAYSARDHDHIVDGKHRTEFDHEAILDNVVNPVDHIFSGLHRNDFDHEAIVGSVKDAEEFDHLSPEESKRRLRILLVKMDLNKDEHIDRNELKAWILRSFKMLSEEESNERFEDADENQDGLVSWQEYKEDAYGSSEEDDALRGTEEETMLQHDKVLFKAADKNGDDVLDRTEFVLFSHPEEYPEMLPHILQNTLQEKDSNNDGAIDFQEFLGERAKKHDKEWLIAEKDKFDKDYDKDGDGKLNANEILSWVVPSNEEIATEEVNHLFDSADDDGDNLLSFEEVLENHETFVGSEATDYGEHLHNIHTFEDEL